MVILFGVTKKVDKRTMFDSFQRFRRFNIFFFQIRYCYNLQVTIISKDSYRRVVDFEYLCANGMRPVFDYLICREYHVAMAILSWV